MKKYYVHLIIVFWAVLLFSCQDAKQTSEKTNLPEIDSTSNPPSIENYSPIFKSILKTDAGMVRGISIGDVMKTIKEKAPRSETQPTDGESYTEYFDDTDLNFADILYVKDSENRVGAISVDIFIENQSSVDSLMNEFKGYFNKKYGQGKGISKMMVWQISDKQHELMLHNVSTAKDPGLRFIFAKNGDKILQ